MTRDETKQILMRIDVAFPTWKPKDLGLIVDVWQEAFAEYPYEVVLTAVRAFISSDRSGFAPSVGQITGLIVDMTQMSQGNELSDMEAWALVGRALRNSAYNSEKEFNKLPYTVQKAVGSPNNLRAWGTDPNYNENVAQSHFLNSYKAIKQRETQVMSLPKQIRDMLPTTNVNPRLVSKEDYE